MVTYSHSVNDVCPCGHVYGDHTGGDDGPCGWLGDCKCPRFGAATATPDPLPPIESPEAIDRDELVRLLELAARGRMAYSKGCSDDVRKLLEVEATTFATAALIARSCSQDNDLVMKGLLPTWMWGEIDAEH